MAAKKTANRSPAANPARGEHSLDLGGKSYRLRPSYEATCAIEQKTGKSLVELVRAGNLGALALETLAVIATEYIRAGAAEDDKMTRAVNAARIGELIFEEGVPGIIGALTLVMVDTLTGGRTASGEAKAVAAPKGDQATAD